MTHAVAVTGVGVITPLGRGTEATWSAMAAGASAICEVIGEGRTAALAWAGTVGDVSLPDGVDRQVQSQWKFLNRGGRLAFVAARDAVADAALPAAVSSSRRALFLATGDLTTADCARLQPAIREASGGRWREVDAAVLNRTAVASAYPFFLLETLANNPFSAICAELGITGSSASLASHSPAGAQALELAFRSIHHGRSDAAVAVGCGSWLSPLPVLEMDGLGLLSRCRQGAKSYRPFDRRRDGFIVGEGAAAMVLETEEHARRRSAPVLAVVEGVGGATETAAGLGVPERVSARALQTALDDAGVLPGDLGFVCAHGSGTPRGDASELRSLVHVLGDERRRVPICALKPYTGHMGAASDIAEVVFGVLAARNGVVPATPNFGSCAEPYADLGLSGSPQPCTGTRFASVSYGAGGQSSAVVVSVR